MKRYSLVNKNGFITIYTLVLLQIVLLFVTMFTTYAKTTAYISKKERSDILEVVIFKHIQEHLKNDTAKDETSEENREEEINDDHWKISYHEYEIQFIRIHQTIYVEYMLDHELKRMEVSLDDSLSHIMKYAYF